VPFHHGDEVLRPKINQKARALSHNITLKGQFQDFYRGENGVFQRKACKTEKNDAKYAAARRLLWILYSANA